MPKTKCTEPAESEHDVSDSYKAYFEYNRILRSWFVACGAGGPALLLIHRDLASALLETNELRLVVGLFFIGAGAQIAGALINKIANYYVYRYTSQNSSTEFFEWLVRQFWIDVCLDFLTLIAFAWAVWLMIMAFANPAVCQ